jgi:hypothetical protein
MWLISDGNWLFIYVTEVGDLEIFKYIYQNGGNTLIKKYDWEEPVDWVVLFETAIKFNRLNIMEYIYDNSGEHERDNSLLERTDFETGITDNIEIIRWIVNKAKERQMDMAWFLKDMLETSVMAGHLDNIKYLVENGADVNSIETITDNIDIIKYLVDNGANKEYIRNK